ncbi:MAG: damage-inducible protein DinB [Acidobacteriia bacterium]|nr:damage-inducible protein DinB [Terriglobia bacterium]
MKYDFLVDTYETERIKVLSVWAMFRDEHLPVRPNPAEVRGRSVHEHMVHQCVSENLWFRIILGIDVGAPPLPAREIRWEFMARYAEDSGKRLAELREKAEAWWEEIVAFFDVRRSRAWVMLRRIAHTAQHRGQLMAMLRMLGSDMHSTYGPSADTGGLMQNHAPTLYAYSSVAALLESERRGGTKRPLPPRGNQTVTERPG